MIGDSGSLHAARVDAPLEMGDLLQRMERLSRQDVSARAFFTQLLEGAVQALGAVGGAVWLQNAADQLQLEYQVNLGATGAVSSTEHQAYHGMLLAAVFAGSEPRAASPRSGLPGAAQAANPTDLLLIAAPLRKDEAALGVIEVFLRPGISPAVQQSHTRMLAMLCDLAADFQRFAELRDLRRRAVLWGQFEQFSQRAHATLDARAAAFVIANDGRLVIGCDRLSVAVRSGRKCRLTAVSGLERFDRRSAAVRQLQRLIHQVARTGEPLWYLDEDEVLPPQWEEPLHAYLDEAHARHLCLVPLYEPTGDTPRPKRARPVGVLAVEWFEAEANAEPVRKRVQAVSDHAQSALANALAFQNVPFLPLLRLAGSLLGPRRLSWVLLTLLVLAIAAATLVFVPAEFAIEARGELQPQLRRDVFAPRDGIVSEIHVRHGDHVEAADATAGFRKPEPAETSQGAAQRGKGLLARLTSLELDYELTRVTGEMATAEKRLGTAGIRMLQLQNARTEEERRERDKLAAEAEELKKLAESLRDQHGILLRQRQEMTVYSPIVGEVLTWNVQQELENRPVQRGQLLLTIADRKGPWVLELHVTDHHMGHVLAAQHEAGNALRVAFILATEPETTYYGRIEHVAMTSENDETHGHSVLVTVAIDEASRRQIPELRPGATVLGRIECGRRALGYVWFHDLIDAMYTWLWFW